MKAATQYKILKFYKIRKFMTREVAQLLVVVHFLKKIYFNILMLLPLISERC